MRIMFTFILAVCFLHFTLGKGLLSKQLHKQKQPDKSFLKATKASYQPSSVITDYWNEGDWGSPSTTHFTYTGEGLLWVSESEWDRVTYTYYEDGKMKDMIMESYNGSEWTFNGKNEFVYDEKGNQSQSLTYSWNGSGWELVWGSRTEAVYDGNGDVIEEIHYSYTYPTGWVEDYGYKTDYVYINGLVSEQIEYERDNGAWMALNKFVWSYNEQDEVNGAFEYSHNGTNFNLDGRYIDVSWYIWNSQGHVETSYIETYTFQVYSGPAYPNEEATNDAYYTNSEKIMATYPEGNTEGIPPVTIEIYQMFDGVWQNDYRWTWEQRTDFESELEESWSGTAWVKQYYSKYYQTQGLVYNSYEEYSNGILVSASKNSEIFDGFGNQIEMKYETHSGDENWMQQSGEKWIYTYDGGTSKVLIKISQDWDYGLSAYVNNMRERFEYTPTNLDDLVKSEIKVFPTVFSSEIVVQTGYPGKVFLYNLGGVKVMEKDVYSGNNLIHTTNLINGYYILKILTSHGESMQKVLKY